MSDPNQPWKPLKPEPTNFRVILGEVPNQDNPNKQGDVVDFYTNDLDEILSNGKTMHDNLIDKINSGTPYGWGYHKTVLEEYGVIEKDPSDPTKYKKKNKADYIVSVKAKIKEKKDKEADIT